MTHPPITILLAAPRGFCAGVDRADPDRRARARAATARRSMCATRSSTTASWSRAWRPRARCSSTSWTRCPTDAPVVFSAHGVPKSVPAEADAPEPDLARRHLPAGQQGPSRGRAPSRRRPPHRADRPCRPSRGDRHDGPAAGGRGDAGRDRSPMPRRFELPNRRSLAYVDADDAVGRRHGRHRRRAAAAASRRSTGRARKTSATPPPTARRR